MTDCQAAVARRGDACPAHEAEYQDYVRRVTTYWETTGKARHERNKARRAAKRKADREAQA